MNRKIGHGVVTTTEVITVDKQGRTANHIEGRIRVDYMSPDHYLLIVDNIQGFGSSIPPAPLEEKNALGPDCGQIWIPDRNVASIRWYTQEW